VFTVVLTVFQLYIAVNMFLRFLDKRYLFLLYNRLSNKNGQMKRDSLPCKSAPRSGTIYVCRHDTWWFSLNSLSLSELLNLLVCWMLTELQSLGPVEISKVQEYTKQLC